MVKHPNKRGEDMVKGIKSRSYNQGIAFCVLNGQRFGHQFTQNHVQQGDKAKGDTKTNGVKQNRIIWQPKAKNSLQQAGDGRLANPAQAQRGEGNAQLNGAEIGVELIIDF